MCTRILCVVTLFVATLFHVRAADTFIITEFMASNSGPFADEDGDFSDWIEIHNPGTNTANIGGWHLTDSANDLTKWEFPPTNIPPNGYLIVFASSKDRDTPGQPLHANFNLGAGGEYLALVDPEGNVVSQFAPQFPPQVARISYGVPVVQTVTTLLNTGAAARVYVPSNDVLADTWIQRTFNDASWLPATTGVGFETDSQGAFTPEMIADSVTEFSGRQGSNNWFYGYWNKSGDPDGTYTDIDFAAFPNENEPYGENNYFDGTSWDWFDADPPFTQITAQGATPNASHGIAGRPDHWPIRRYISEWNGPLKITGRVTHTSDWVYVTATGVAANSLLYVYLTAAGDGYIDDMRLVAGTTPEVGPNLLPNGDFETSVAPWTVSANHSGSSLVTHTKRSGNTSLHMVASAGGTTQASSIWQTIAPALTSGATYTLSFWFKPGTNPAPLTVRFSGDWIRVSPTFCGNGVTARIFVDGTEVLQQPAYVATVNYSVTVPVSVGSRVDFALDPGTNDFCDASVFTAQMETADPASTVVADSIADWSFSGTQGEKNWYYGYYNRTADPGATYAPGDFTPFPRNSGSWGLNNYWDGSKWDWFAGNPPWDEIGQTAMHPNGANNPAGGAGGEHWVIRRWVSEVSGRIVVEWRMAKSNPAGAGVTGRVLHNGVQKDFATIGGTDTTGVNRSVTITNVSIGDFIDIALDPTGVGGDTSDSSDGSTMSVTIRGAPNLNDAIATDIRAAMQNVNSTAYIRVPFNVPDVSAIGFLSLLMNYDDGFVAYLNGVQVAGRNYSFFPDPLTWNSPATANRPDGVVNETEAIDITEFAGLLQNGQNVLAIHGLNFSPGDSDFLILPRLEGTAVSFGTNAGYFASATPGAANGEASTNIGPLIAEVVHAPNVPHDTQDLVVTAHVVPTFFPVSTVQMTYRVMFSNEVTVPMFDDGAHGDGAAGDRIFGATIPAAAAEPGQMVRYYIFATDTRTNRSRLPVFDNPIGSPEYFGTIVYLEQTNSLPILHWFISNPSGANNDTGTRCSIFYNGQFRDNVGVTLHGQSSAGFPKRAHNFNLNRGEKIVVRPDYPPVSDFAMLSTWADRSHLRNAVNSETYQMAGVPSHYSFPIRVQQNGTFYCVANWIEQGDEEYLERIGYDPNGALYKMYNTFTGAAGNEKKSRKHETSDDLQQFYNALTQADVPARTAHIWDNVNIPATIDFLATKTIGSDHDCCHKNYYLYRDSDGSGEWYALPWDFDLSYGHVWTSGNGNYFDDTIYTNVATSVGNNMTLFALMFNDPAMRQMWNRRTRTLIDQILQPANTPPEEDILRNRIDYWADQIRADATLDKIRWGGASWSPPLGGAGPANPTTTNPTNNFEIELSRIKDYYLRGRRLYLANLSAATIPPPQPADVKILFGSFDYSPASTNQAEEYIELINTNNFAVDVSGWQIRGGIEFTFAPGTIIPTMAANGTNRIYVSPDVKAFRARSVAPHGRQRLMVVGPYKGQLSARGETLALVNDQGVTNAVLAFAGSPSGAQLYLRITELMYAPPPPPAGSPFPREDFEYIELKNIGPVAIDLNGVHFTNGIDFVFSPANITSLAAGATVILARNPAAFASRYPSVTVPVFAYAGSLNNGGERIQLDDAIGEKILEFEYDNNWYPMTDGNGLSLVIVNEQAPFNTWDRKESWRPSSAFLGSPAVTDPPPVTFAPILVNEVLTHTDPPAIDSIELYNPTANPVDIGNWLLSDDFSGPTKFRIPAPTIIPAGGYVVFTDNDFNSGGTGFSLSSLGDEAYLFSGDAAGNPSGYFHGFEFGSAENGVSFGRYLTSTGAVHFVAQATNSLGAANGLPKVGPIVISEIMYRPPDVNGGDNVLDEFIELQNITTNAVPLYDPLFRTNRWRIEDGVEFTFSTNDVVPPNGFIIVVSFDPATNAAALARFRTIYGVDPAVPIVGPYSGVLGNAGDNLLLYKPDAPEPGEVPYILVEQVRFGNVLPWDGAADGFGPSLQRQVSAAYGNDHTNWMAALPSAGAGRNPGQAPAITQQPQDLVVVEGTPASLSVQVSGTPPYGFQWFRNGQSLAGETSSTLSLTNPIVAQSGQYSVVIFNGAGAVFSSNAVVVVRPLPVIVAQPQSQNVRNGTNVTISVGVNGTGTIRYQWRFNGEDIVGGTNASYSFNNAQLFVHTGEYSVWVEDEVAGVMSQPALIRVLVTPVITNQPVLQVVAAGQTARFAVVAGPDHPLVPLSYRWLRNGVTFPSDGQPVLVINNSQANGTFRVVVTNLAGSVNSQAVGLTVLADTDGDGLPDAWETQYFGAEGAAGTADADGDGLSNAEEFVAGTDPTDAASVLKLIRSVTNSAVLNFVAQTNKGYTVQYRTNLAEALWQRVTNVGTSPQVRTIEVTVPYPSLEPERFYQVVTPPLP